MQKMIEAERMPGGKGRALNDCKVGKNERKLFKTITKTITKTMSSSSFMRVPGLPTHYPLQLSSLIFYHFQIYQNLLCYQSYEADFVPEAPTTCSPRLICTNDSMPLLAAVALYLSRHLPSFPDSLLLNFSRLYQLATGQSAVILQRSWCCTSNYVRIKLLTRV